MVSGELRLVEVTGDDTMPSLVALRRERLGGAPTQEQRLDLVRAPLRRTWIALRMQKMLAVVTLFPDGPRIWVRPGCEDERDSIARAVASW